MVSFPKCSEHSVRRCSICNPQMDLRHLMSGEKETAEREYCHAVFGALHFPFSTNEIVEAFMRERALARAEVEAKYAELVEEAIKAFDAAPDDDPSLDALHAALVKLGK